MYCQHCGTYLENGSKYCVQCGTAVAAAPAQFQEPVGQVRTVYEDEDIRKRKIKTRWMVGVVSVCGGLLFIALLCAVIYFRGQASRNLSRWKQSDPDYTYEYDDDDFDLYKEFEQFYGGGDDDEI